MQWTRWGRLEVHRLVAVATANSGPGVKKTCPSAQLRQLTQAASWVSQGHSIELVFTQACRSQRWESRRSRRKQEGVNVDKRTVGSATLETGALTESHRTKRSKTRAPLPMLIVPLTVLFFFCVTTHSFINLCIHLIRGIFFGNCELYTRHGRGGITGHCSLMWSVWIASSVKVGTETEMLLLSTSTRKKDVRILKKYHVSWLGDLIEC